MGQATWKQPWASMSLYASWRRFAELDYGVAMMGLGPMRKRIRMLPESPRDCIALALRRLATPAAGTTEYLHAALLDKGWLHLFHMQDDSGLIHQRLPGQGWEPVREH
jgi:uncharacterized protein YbcC (UPF0753/DUF2309 family)